MVRFVIIACMCALSAHNRHRAPKTLIHEVAGSHPERVADIAAIITKHAAPPTAILDAHYVEERTGDDSAGPSDFRAFYLVEVVPQDLPLWTRLLTPLAAQAEYAAPTEPRDWWIARAAFAKLQFYQSVPLTGLDQGWIGVSPETGHIYVFTFKMG
jgi:hypothetical protein